MSNNSYTLKRLDGLEAVEQRYHYIKKEFPELESIAKRSVIENCIYHGQMAIKFLSADEQDKAFDYLNEVNDKYRLTYNEYADEKITHRGWLSIASKSLKTACRIKNIFGIGM